MTFLHLLLASAAVEVTTRGVNKTFGWRWCPCNKVCGVVNALRPPVGFDSPPTHKGSLCPLMCKEAPQYGFGYQCAGPPIHRPIGKESAVETVQARDKLIYTVPEVADMLRMHKETVLALCRSGELRATQHVARSRWRIPAAEVERFAMWGSAK